MRVLMQAYVEALGDCEERGISHLPAHEVHKIAVLDMRLGNCDRNGGRLFFRTVSATQWTDAVSTSGIHKSHIDTCGAPAVKWFRIDLPLGKAVQFEGSMCR